MTSAEVMVVESARCEESVGEDEPTISPWLLRRDQLVDGGVEVELFLGCL